MKKIHGILIAVLLLTGCQRAPQEEMGSRPFVEEVSPASAGFNPDTLLLIHDQLQAAVDSQWVEGGVALVASHGKIVYYEAVGYSDLERSDPLQKDDIFRMASMTKPITTVAVMQLVEQGKIGLQDPVSKYIPAFADPEVLVSVNEEDSTYTARAADREITIHHLLTHTSGIAYGVFHPVAGPVYAKSGVVEGWTTAPVTLAENVPLMGDLPLVHDPGEGWTYGLSIDVLGRIVEIASGQPLDAYFEEHIFEPLGMTDTYFYLPEEKAGRLVDVYHTDAFDSAPVPADAGGDFPIAGAQTYFAGGAGLSSTALDYFLVCDALRQGGARNGHRILAPETVARMTENEIDTLWVYEGGKFGYGFAVQVAEGNNGTLPGRYGWGGYFQTTFWIDPARDVVSILLTNAWPEGHWDPLQRAFEDLVNRAATLTPSNTPS
jgi:CubicO group peptidase (beta-lactamase class C family)